ncbi:aminoglycoside phosphotransferase family protein [Actinomadura sp. WMMB 499]|uniref:aminoglycoside phosphotransferase family protein n=1 Tax=Actinomadura sp. WMMB 499 TaxID=1219491 RepID=UPI001248BA36|nr:aminoglycoside phosphotransferase family protein [Actinomadura sp. WMMB 499]QFG20078.1 aminoglycoside phosphotransferase family protein [Actinomadura sp. WMMB 499]
MSRLPWERTPDHVRADVEELLGARVAEAVTQPGGYSPGAAARLRLDDGRRAFVKSVGAEPNPDSPTLHRAEARVAAALPPSAPVPRLLGSFDRDGWVTLVFEDVDGAPPREPWDTAELGRVLDALGDLAAAMTPAPIEAPTAAERFGAAFRGWRRLAAAGDPDGLDPWAREHLADLARLETSWETAAAGGTLAHADVRADNILLAPGRVVIVDWPWACLSAPWFDLLTMLPSVRLQGGPPPAEVFAAHPLADATDEGAVTAVLAATAGYFVHSARQPPPPGLPTLRAFQRAQGEIALAWLRDRLE